jgi:predicted RNA-binding Zn ribbon-like protein
LVLSLRYAVHVIADPGQRDPAPEPLRLVQAFVNTRDIENGIDELSSAAALGRVLAELRIPVPAASLGDAELATALETREALRALALGNSGLPVDRAHLETLERVAGAARYTIALDGGGARLVPAADGLDGALGRILAVVERSMADGSWWRLKGCPRNVCHWAFYDRSRNGSGKWCAMSVCGNRTNTRSYRRRAAARR